MSIIKGFGIGLAMVIFVGPVFFTLLKTSLQYGRLPGVMLALGIVLSDLAVVVLCGLGISALVANPANQIWLSFAGAVILLAIGIRYLLRPTAKMDSEKVVYSKAHLYALPFAKGFLVNFVNPFVFGVWIAMLALGVDAYGHSVDLYLFVGAALCAIFLTDVAKVFLADKISHWITATRLQLIYRIAGGVLLVFAVRLLVFGFMHLNYSAFQ